MTRGNGDCNCNFCYCKVNQFDADHADLADQRGYCNCCEGAVASVHCLDASRP